MSQPKPSENMYVTLTEEEMAIKESPETVANSKAHLELAEEAERAGDLKKAQVHRRIIGDLPAEGSGGERRHERFRHYSRIRKEGS